MSKLSEISKVLYKFQSAKHYWYAMDVLFSKLFGIPQSELDPSLKFCECWRPDRKTCKEMLQKTNPKEVLEDDLEDIVNSLLQVMCICRLRPWEVRRLREPIKRSFRHYEEIRYRVNRLPKKRFAKENFLHDVALIGGMTRMDGQLVYGIVKRAFQAYYHGTGEQGKRAESVAKQMRHRSECLWAHAARRTAEVFAIYAGLMYSEQMQYEKCIQCVYRNLYRELQARFKYETPSNDMCACRGDKNPNNLDAKVKMAPSAATMLSNVTTEIFFNSKKFEISNATSAVSVQKEQVVVSMQTLLEPPKKIKDKDKDTDNKEIAPSGKPSELTLSSEASKTSRKKKKKLSRRQMKRLETCNCPPLYCSTEVPPPAPAITAESSQGPYICRWLPDNGEEDLIKHHEPFPPMEVICPPCKDRETSCDEECTCTCQVCTCLPSFGDMIVEEEHAEKLSATGLEDRDTDFCWLAPFRDPEWPPLERMAEEEELPLSDSIEVYSSSRSTGSVQSLMYTYLKPFRSLPKIPDVVKPETVEEETKPGRPCGVSMETYRCWVKTTGSSEEESEPPVCPTCPQLALLAKGHRRCGKKGRKKGGETGRTANAMKSAAVAHEVKKKAETAQKTSDTSVKKPPPHKFPILLVKDHKSSGPVTIKSATLTPVRAPVRGETLPQVRPPVANTRTPVAAPSRPPAKAQTYPPPSRTQQPSATSQGDAGETLTKEDIIKMLGF